MALLNALNHTARFSLPQQKEMARFSSAVLFDRSDSYKVLCQLMARRRCQSLFEGLGLPLPADGARVRSSVELDLMTWLEKEYGSLFAEFLRENYTCADLLLRLAEHSGVAAMQGSGFGRKDWSVRVSLANLPEQVYRNVGDHLREVVQTYLDEWSAT